MTRNIENFDIGSILGFNKRYLYPVSKEHLSKLKDWRNSQNYLPTPVTISGKGLIFLNFVSDSNHLQQSDLLR